MVLAAISAFAATEVVAGGANGGPALWVSADGGSVWNRAVLDGPASLTQAGAGQLTAVAHGAAGWLAVGTWLADTGPAGTGGPLVAVSPDARTWTVTGGIPGLSAASAVAAGVAAGPAGYVIVGHQPAARGDAAATAWYAPGLTGWRRATITQRGTSGGQLMNAVTATARGFTAVGAAGTRPAAWLSAAGQTWQQVPLPVPGGAARAALDYVAANGAEVVAAGTEFNATGAASPFAEVSVNAGTTWTLVTLPVPGLGPGTTGSGSGATVTALTAAGGGFTATGTYPAAAGPEVVVWTLPPGARATGWLAVTPQGVGLASSATQNAITALTADGATLTGVGFTAAVTASGTPGAQEPTLWQSPIRN